jgi:hypothetical protein
VTINININRDTEGNLAHVVINDSIMTVRDYNKSFILDELVRALEASVGNESLYIGMDSMYARGDKLFYKDATNRVRKCIYLYNENSKEAVVHIEGKKDVSVVAMNRLSYSL